MYIYPDHIKKLEKKVPKIDYLDIGSRGDIQGWFKVIQKNLNVINRFEADDGVAIFNEKIEGTNLFLTKDPSRSSLFEPNKILSIYEKQSSRLDFQKKKNKHGYFR